jgi:hypothetical protein
MKNSKNRQKFVDLANKRVTRALKDLRLIGNLSNKTNYSYTDQDVRKIVSALEREVKDLKRKFTTKTESDDVVFKLE